MTDFLVRKKAADYIQSKGLPMEAKTLSNLAYEGRGPKYSHFGKNCVVYLKEDLDAWIAASLKPADIDGASVSAA